jgi:hypothetical protein
MIWRDLGSESVAHYNDLVRRHPPGGGQAVDIAAQGVQAAANAVGRLGAAAGAIGDRAAEIARNGANNAAGSVAAQHAGQQTNTRLKGSN